MKPNGIDIRSINPRRGEKYSPYLHAFLSSPRHATQAMYAMVYRDPRGTLWLGYLDEHYWFTGSTLMSVLCAGKRAGIMAYSPRIGQKLTEVRGFWKRYIADGRCAIDRSHELSFVNSRGRWKTSGNTRSCTWCGKVTQRKEKYEVVEHKERWVNVK